jgi:hypothetical protein
MSVQVHIIGWKEGLNKVRLNHLLRQYTHLGLAEAKSNVDELLLGGRIMIDCDSPELAREFVEQAASLGAICESTG